MKTVLEVKLKKPIEVAWDGQAPMPVITLRRPDKVSYDPAEAMLWIDTGLGMRSVSFAGGVERMALEGDWPSTPTPSPSKASASEDVANPPASGQGPTSGTGQAGVIRRRPSK